VKDKLATLLIAVLGGAVGVLGVGKITDAGADSPAASQRPVIVRVESPSATAGGDTSLVRLSDVAGLCALRDTKADDDTHGSRGTTNVSARSASRANAGAAVNSSGNSANTNTNVVALNNQIGLEQKTIVVQDSQNTAAADATQDQNSAQQQDTQQQQTTDQTQGTTTTTQPVVTSTQDPTPTTTTTPSTATGESTTPTTTDTTSTEPAATSATTN
jgi:hypothetical protein